MVHKGRAFHGNRLQGSAYVRLRRKFCFVWGQGAVLEFDPKTFLGSLLPQDFMPSPGNILLQGFGAMPLTLGLWLHPKGLMGAPVAPTP